MSKIVSARVSRRALISATLAAGASAAPLPALAQECVKEPFKGAPALDPDRLLTDWAWLGRYRDDNRKVILLGPVVQAVFMGDSITEGWASSQPDFFNGRVVGRGISAQTTPQMLVRMQQDVVALRPRVVHIMAGTNDIASNTGPMTAEDTRNNIRAMADIARSNGIKVVLASIPPAANYPWRPGLETAQAIIEMNSWIRTYAQNIGGRYADYHGAMSDGKGGMKPGLASDEVHPTAQGYAVMRPIAEAAIR
jgi:lysophospholipase L1-like esterase